MKTYNVVCVAYPGSDGHSRPIGSATLDGNKVSFNGMSGYLMGEDTGLCGAARVLLVLLPLNGHNSLYHCWALYTDESVKEGVTPYELRQRAHKELSARGR